MLSVQDWVQIRRLHRGGGFADQVDRSGAGVSKNTVKAAWASDGPLKCDERSVVRSSMRWSRRSGVGEGLPADAGHGDRRADRLADSQFRDRLVDSGRDTRRARKRWYHIRLARGP